MLYPQMGTFGGLKVLVKPDHVEVRRTLKERLLSWPWRPWVRKKWIDNPIFQPGAQGYRMGDTLLVKESFYQQLKEHTVAKEYLY